MKTFYKKSKPERKFEVALQHFDLQKIVYHSKLSATLATVIYDTIERACMLYTKTRPLLPDLKRHFTITKGPNIF